MKLFHFAVASIVDANTGYGLVRASGGSASQVAETRDKRATFALFASVRKRVSALVSASRARAQARRDLQLLLNMSDRQLDDIGLLRNDLYRVQAGIINLGDLQAQRRLQNRQGLVELKSPARAESVDRSLEAINEQNYAPRKCG